ncbi:MAG: sigma-70 family RNA polymerase sigma factor [Eubacterium sp.]|nr:sigma-70 family RNA polymerase sigma factor [Eubacterium sp.]
MEDQSFDKIYEQYGKMLYRTAFLYLGNADDTEDILQEVFIKYLTARPEFNGSDHERAWLLLVTRNACRNFVKKSRKGNVSLEEYDAPAYSADRDERLDILRKVTALPPKYKEVIILFYYNGLTIEEIGALLGLSRSAVKMRLKRGKEKLKISLEGYDRE